MKSASILLVDDKIENIKSMEAVLSSLDINLEIFTAKSGREALELNLEHDFCLVVMDVKMPEMDGLETAELLRSKSKSHHLPIIFVTAGDVDPNLTFQGYDAGAVDFLYKPIEPHILRSKVRIFAERKLAEAAIKEQSRALQEKARLIDLSADAIIVQNPDGQIDFWSRGAEILYGWTAEEAIGRSASALLESDLPLSLDEIISQIRLLGQWEGEVRQKTKSGCKVVVKSRWVLHKKAEDSTIEYLLQSNTDITDRIRTADELRSALAKADAANRAKSQFLANMSHEIRTPLGAIMGFSELLKVEELSDEESDSFVDIIIRNCHGLTRIIDSILDLAKVEAGQVEIELIETSLVGVLEEVYDLFHKLAEDKNIEFSIYCSPNLPKRILTDPGRLRQILINIISNAIKFTDYGYVRLRVDSKPDMTGQESVLEFRVEDSGTGIPVDQQGKLFHAFTQADASTTRKYGGTGLGLALSRSLAQLLRGNLELRQSTPGEGSIFSASIMAKVLDSDDDKDFHHTQDFTVSGGIAKGKELDGIRVLLAEDSNDNQEFLERMLRLKGAQTEIASDGQEAVNKAIEQDFDIVLMDIQLPELDGVDATQSLRRSGFTKPIIAVTAHAMKEERDRCLSAGCDEHLAKPVNPDQLTETVLFHVQKYKNQNRRSRQQMQLH